MICRKTFPRRIFGVGLASDLSLAGLNGGTPFAQMIHRLVEPVRIDKDEEERKDNG